jgi:hypothetical protein
LANKNAEKMPNFSIVNNCHAKWYKILIILNIFDTQNKNANFFVPKNAKKCLCFKLIFKNKKILQILKNEENWFQKVKRESKIGHL